jgi:hypothetical protein
MNRIQMISQEIESDRLKLQMGLSPDMEIDTLTLRAMWARLCAERDSANRARAASPLRR